jgi:hypothetical protein
MGIAVPESVFGSSDRTAREFAAAANQAAEQIAEERDWQRLRRLATITGDGSTQAWSRPSDYSRMPDQTKPQSATGCLENVVDGNTWLAWQLQGWSPATPGAWSMIGDKIEILPVLSTGAVVKYWYQSDKIVRTDGDLADTGFPYTLPFVLADSDAYGFAQTEFINDTDHFQLDWKLLELCIIWRWKAGKGLPYAEDMQNFELRKAWLGKKDAGPRTVTVGGPLLYDDVEMAYPVTLRAS